MKLPQFTLRDLFWLVALVAMGCAWWVERAERAAVENNLTEQKRIAAHWRDHAMTLAEHLQTLDYSVMLRDEHGNEVRPIDQKTNHLSP